MQSVYSMTPADGPFKDMNNLAAYTGDLLIVVKSCIKQDTVFDRRRKMHWYAPNSPEDPPLEFELNFSFA